MSVCGKKSCRFVRKIMLVCDKNHIGLWEKIMSVCEKIMFWLELHSALFCEKSGLKVSEIKRKLRVQLVFEFSLAAGPKSLFLFQMTS